MLATQRWVFVEGVPFVEVTMTWDTTGFGLEYHNISWRKQGELAFHKFATTQNRSLRFRRNKANNPAWFGMPIVLQVMPVNGLGQEGIPALTIITLDVEQAGNMMSDWALLSTLTLMTPPVKTGLDAPVYESPTF
jgi:hypothetical protein